MLEPEKSWNTIDEMLLDAIWFMNIGLSIETESNLIGLKLIF